MIVALKVRIRIIVRIRVITVLTVIAVITERMMQNPEVDFGGLLRIGGGLGLTWGLLGLFALFAVFVKRALLVRFCGFRMFKA